METEILICQCHSLEHQATFSWIGNDEDGDVYMEVHLAPLGFWQRVVNGIKYIFGHRSKYGDFDDMIIKKEDAWKLERIVKYLKK
jgi:hypothetical protein